jgi:hypothetical protein
VLPVEKKDIYRDASDAQQALRDILHKIEQDAQQYKRWDRYATVHKRWREKPHTLTEKDTDLLISMHYEEPIRLDRPSPLIFMDDMSHSNIYSPSSSSESRQESRKESRRGTYAGDERSTALSQARSECGGSL